MQWKEWFERNAFFVVVGACVATGGVVASVMEFYSKQVLQITKERDSAQIANLTTQLSSITRSMGHEEYLDVRKFVVPRSHAQPPAGSHYFDAADFYAPIASGEWTDSESTEAALIQMLTGAKIPLAQKIASIATIHLWRAKSAVSISGNSPFKQLFPYVYVERVPVDKYKSVIGAQINEDEEKTEKPTTLQSGDHAGAKGPSPELDSLFRGDAAGQFLTFFLVGAMQLAQAGGIGQELLNVQKVGNVVYVATRYTLKDVMVQGKKRAKYWIYQECIMISDGPDLVLIYSLIPSGDPDILDSRHYAEYISSWLNNLRILVG